MENVADDLAAISATVAPNALVPVIVGYQRPADASRADPHSGARHLLGGNGHEVELRFRSTVRRLDPADKIADLAHGRGQPSTWRPTEG
jgi:hypothetical protein